MGSKDRKTTPTTTSTAPNTPTTGRRCCTNGTSRHIQHSPGTPITGLRERGNDTSRSTGRSGRQNAATRRNMRRDERVTVQGPVKKHRPDGMSHRGGSEGLEMAKCRLRNSFLPLMAKGKFCRRRCRTLFRGATSGPKSGKKFSFKECLKAHQIDQRNVLSAKYGGGGGRTSLFFSGSKVKIGQNWPAEIRRRGWGGGIPFPISIPGPRLLSCLLSSGASSPATALRRPLPELDPVALCLCLRWPCRAPWSQAQAVGCCVWASPATLCRGRPPPPVFRRCSRTGRSQRCGGRTPGCSRPPSAPARCTRTPRRCAPPPPEPPAAHRAPPTLTPGQRHGQQPVSGTADPGAPLTQPKHVRAHRGSE